MESTKSEQKTRPITVLMNPGILDSGVDYSMEPRLISLGAFREYNRAKIQNKNSTEILEGLEKLL
jgi:hypothetical protein